MGTYFRSLICILALAAIAPTSSAQTPQSLASRETQPSELVRRFYEWYIRTLSQDRDPVTQNRATLKTYVSATLIEEIDRRSKSPDGLEIDYFLQTQDYLDEWASHISALQTARKGAEATVVVTFGVKGATAYKLTVRLRNESLSWMITKVEPYRN
jgi:hypothetical protein